MRRVHMRSALSTGSRRLDFALVALRVFTGLTFAAHGGQKLFILGLSDLTGAFESMGIPLAAVAAPAVAFGEFLGGLALIVGLLTRLSGAGLAVIMLGAVCMVHLPGGFFLPDGIEFALLLFGISVALVVAGPGGFSMDAVLVRRREVGR
jgi:putative oxidoreductase